MTKLDWDLVTIDGHVFDCEFGFTDDYEHPGMPVKVLVKKQGALCKKFLILVLRVTSL